MRRGSSDSTHDPAGELDRDLADLAAQLLEDAIALGADLLLRARHGRLRLLLGLGLQVARAPGRPCCELPR